MSKPIPVLQTRISVKYVASISKDTMYLAGLDVMPDLLSFSYNDKETDEADEISFVLKDPDGKWGKMFRPTITHILRVSIFSGDIEKESKELYCGYFYTDEISVRGAPRTCEFRAMSIPFNTDIRRTLKSRAWEKKSLNEIAEAIVKESGDKRKVTKKETPSATLLSAAVTAAVTGKDAELTEEQRRAIALETVAVEFIRGHNIELVVDIQEKEARDYFFTVTHDRIEQQWESDLAFLSKQCKDNGFSIKLKDVDDTIQTQIVDQIIIFDQASYEKKKPIKTLKLGESNILSWEFSSLQSEMYKSCTIKYSFTGNMGDYDEDLGKSKNGYIEYDEDLDGKKKQPTAYTYYDPDLQAAGQGQEYVMKKRAKGLRQAERLAKAKLHELNKKAVTGSIKLVGDVDLIAGVVVECKGFGIFDGNFIVGEATHEVGGDGYTTSIQLRRVNSNY